MTIYERLKEEVSIYDLFDSTGLKYDTKAKPTQISCPFHGVDKHPSARVYPDTNSMRCFNCSQSWNSVTFWAESNDWYTNTDKLDIGRAIDDLCKRFEIDDTTFDWETKFYSIKKESEVGKEDSEDDKHRLAIHYSWKVARMVHALDLAARQSAKSDILELWDAFDSLDSTAGDWQEALITWYKSAKVILYEEGL